MLQETLKTAVMAAGAELEKFFRGEFAVSMKEGQNNPVTEADKAAEAVIIETIRNAFPDHDLLTEESGHLASASPYQWIIDPLDGTVNFAHGIPLCCVSIGIAHHGETILGAVYNPFLKEFFWAERGKGATLNGQPLRVSQQSELAHACLVTGFPYTYVDHPNGPVEVAGRFIKQGNPLRRLGSAAIDLCWLAAGRFDAYFEHHLQPWDAAAGVLIVQEAGGTVTDYLGRPHSIRQPQLLATNGKLHADMLTAIHWQP